MPVLDALRRPLWDDLPGAPMVERPALHGAHEVDVVVVGAGFTGLWTAYYLLRAEPDRSVMVIDAERVGFGASGRNGGWCSTALPTGLATLAARYGEAAAAATHRAMVDTIDEVGSVIAREEIEAGWAKGGWLHAARTGPQLERLRRDLADDRRLGDEDSIWLDAHDAGERIVAAGVLGAVYTPNAAALHPGPLVRGLALAVERLGGTIRHDSPVASIESRRVSGTSFTVTAPVVVRATEAYTSQLRGTRRAIVPIYSLMIATEPLPDHVWARLGWRGRETFNDARRLVVYGQRTADGRIAFGGRGAPYHWGSRISPAHDVVDGVHLALADTLGELFPVLRDVHITHRWGGPLGVARDWEASVGFDPTAGVGWAGGYVGDGVAASNLAGRTLAALIDRRDEPIVRLPWVGHRSPRWEPEPLRWPAITAALRLTGSIDRAEASPGRKPAWRTTVLDRLTGG